MRAHRAKEKKNALLNFFYTEKISLLLLASRCLSAISASDHNIGLAVALFYL